MVSTRYRGHRGSSRRRQGFTREPDRRHQARQRKQVGYSARIGVAAGISMNWRFSGRGTMAEHEVVTSDAEIEAALERAKVHDGDPVAPVSRAHPGAQPADRAAQQRRRLALPIEDVQGLGRATHEQIQITNCSAEEPAQLPGPRCRLVRSRPDRGVYGNRRWMAQLARWAAGPGQRPSAGSQGQRRQGWKAAENCSRERMSTTL